MGKLSTIAIFAFFAILLLNPESCLAESTVPGVLSGRKCKTSSDQWRPARKLEVYRTARGRDEDQPRPTDPSPVVPSGPRP
ncbi:hypothetical protein OWV82_010139 [Melia azedarach]|uniref:Uncharacterized protein n=1 Tax=Melia azedarach TaxID=155640 RepID=A0ACC1Y417_MELAZ|nr:hypothetical protein OWV82_010139 [Melia azedarach]